ncbi:MAG: hypothetical protein Q9227_002401 [Pyrenula ochraceoflavens]
MRIRSSLPQIPELASIIRLWPLLLVSTWHIQHAASQNTVPTPQLDLDQLKRVGLAGDFDAISVYTTQGQSESASRDGQQAILKALPDGGFSQLALADAHITAMCPYVDKSGQFLGVVVGGNFTTLGNTSNTQSIALFDPSNYNVIALPGIEGTVSSLLCDQDTNAVYVGGQFKAAGSNNAIAWVGGAPKSSPNAQGGQWTNLPFAGFNAPVTSITKAPNGHIVFGGSFSGLGNTTAPEPRDSQIINLSAAQVTATSSSDNSDFNDARSILCPKNGTSGPGRTWLLADNQPGYWQATTHFGYIPTKLRLWNANQDGRGVRTFRFFDVDNAGILNLTTTDPSTGDLISCSSQCHLAQNDSNSFQDFSFVNEVGVSTFRIEISEWYGSAGGLNGIELFEDDIFAYAINDFNEPTCANLSTPSTATVNGPWQNLSVPGAQSDYLSINLASADADSASVVFKPDISQAGNYSITVFTPGCRADNTCLNRGEVNITANLGSSGSTPAKPLSTTIFQSNDFDKYDQVFMTYVEASSDSFRPSVTLTPVAGQANQKVVASRVKFAPMSNTGGLNGLFDYDPNRAVTNTDFSQSAINRAGTELKQGASITSLSTEGNTIYAGGKFSDDVFENIMAFRNNNATSLQDSGLNGEVFSLYTTNDVLYLGGNFTNAASGNVDGLSNIASWSYSHNEWVSLGAGLNGRVDAVVPLQLNVTGNQPETTITFNGDFDQIIAFGSNPARSVSGFAVWVPSRKNWLQNLDVVRMALAGQLSTSVTLPNNTQYVAGSLGSRGEAISGAVSLEASSSAVTLGSLGANIRPAGGQTPLRKRALTTVDGIDGVVTGHFYVHDDLNVTVLGGHFAATATNGSVINNLIFINGSQNNEVSGLPSGLGENATFLAMDTHETTLFAGGSLSGEISNANVNGLIAVDLASGGYATNQPPALNGDNVIVNAVAPRPDSSDIWIGGSFETAGSLGCPSVCVFQSSNNHWMRPGTALGGVVTSLVWTSNSKLTAAGNMTVNGRRTFIANYDTKKQQWSTVATESVPGPVTAFALEKSDASRFWIAGTASNGSTYLMERNGDTFKSIGDRFGPNTDLRGLQVLRLSKSHDSSDLLDNDQTLLVTGLLELPNFGNASAALFDGQNLQPFILSTTANGEPGSLSQLFSQNVNQVSGSGSRHSKGIVILVALCAALGCIFLIILAGIITDRVQRRRAGYSSIPNAYNDKHSNIGRVPPEHLFSQLGGNGRSGPPTV